MDRLWKVFGLAALLLVIPTTGHAYLKSMGRGSEDGRGTMVPFEGRGDYLMMGRGLQGRGAPVACWNYSEQRDWSCGECGSTNEYWKDRCWSCNTKRFIAQPHDDI